MRGSNKQVLHAKIIDIISCTSQWYKEEKTWDDDIIWDQNYFDFFPPSYKEEPREIVRKEYNYELKIIFISEGRIIETTILYSSEYGGLQIGDELCITTLKSDPNTVLYVTRYNFFYKFTLITLFVLIGIILLAMIDLFLPK
jgi:hypothetical protein